jgi:CRISPR system Cascade subunit CasE
MYLSCLLIALGDNPDRPRPGRLWLRNLYHVHQRLCMAFPSASRRADDKDFLKPFNPEDFGSGQVHVQRKDDSGFLFRIDPHLNGRAVILVQSAIEPDWEYAFHNACYLLAAPPQVKPFPPFTKGRHFRFCLVANPTRRLSKNSPDVKAGSIGKRVPVQADQLFDWLTRQADKGGFSVDEDSIAIQTGYVYVNKKRDDKGQRMRSVRYEGILEVTDPAAFKEILIRGIGSGKAFGFGLLSVAPVSSEAK